MQQHSLHMLVLTLHVTEGSYPDFFGKSGYGLCFVCAVVATVAALHFLAIVSASESKHKYII